MLIYMTVLLYIIILTAILPPTHKALTLLGPRIVCARLPTLWTPSLHLTQLPQSHHRPLLALLSQIGLFSFFFHLGSTPYITKALTQNSYLVPPLVFPIDTYFVQPYLVAFELHELLRKERRNEFNFQRLISSTFDFNEV